MGREWFKDSRSIFDGETIRSFSQSYDRFTLRSNDFFRYLQLWNYITNHKQWGIIKRSPANVEKYFINITEHGLPIKNHIARIYRKLMQDKSDDSFHTKRNLELELNTIIEDEMWANICASCHKGISSQIWKELDWKLIMRFFRVALVVAKFGSSSQLSQCCEVYLIYLKKWQRIYSLHFPTVLGTNRNIFVDLWNVVRGFL